MDPYLIEKRPSAFIHKYFVTNPRIRHQSKTSMKKSVPPNKKQLSSVNYYYMYSVRISNVLFVGGEGKHSYTQTSVCI